MPETALRRCGLRLSHGCHIRRYIQIGPLPLAGRVYAQPVGNSPKGRVDRQRDSLYIIDTDQTASRPSRLWRFKLQSVPRQKTHFPPYYSLFDYSSTHRYSCCRFLAVGGSGRLVGSMDGLGTRKKGSSSCACIIPEQT